MGFPAEEDDRLTRVGLLGNLGQHALFRGFDDLEPVKAEGARGDHVEDQAVAVVAGFDPVDLAFKGILVGGDVLEVGNAEGGTGLVGGQGVFGAFQVGANGFDLARVTVRGQIGLHRRHPVAEEHVDVAFGKAGVGDGDGEDLGLGLISQRLGDQRSRGSGGGDVGPADIREDDLVAAFGKGGPGQRKGDDGGEKGRTDGHAGSPWFFVD